MSEQPAETIILNNVLDDLIYLNALLDLLIGNLMKQTYFCHGEIAFPLFCCKVANSRYQNYKRDIKKKAKGTEDKIRLLLSFVHTDTLSPFDPNFYLEKFVQHFEDYKIKMSRHYKKQHQQGSQQLPSSPTLRKKMTTVMMKVLRIIRIITMLMFLPLVLIAVLHSNKRPLLVWLSLS
jgi:hypothetical protein